MPAEKKLRTVKGQPSFRVSAASVEAFVTRAGGHMAPVTFLSRGRKLRPYSIAPWAEEGLSRKQPSLLRSLRGDFFCMPFGANARPYRSESHPPHGETANSLWRWKSKERIDQGSRLCLHLRTRARSGQVDKEITLLDGHPVLYSRHTISEMSGVMNYGHHAMLRFPDAEGSGLISTSKISYAQTAPQPFEDPASGGYSMLRPDAPFASLDRVPTLHGDTVDVSRYPARRGFEDLVQLLNDPAHPQAWTAVSFPRERYVWFALKDARVLTGTLLWISNGGRHYPPWSGRHVDVMGIEDLTSYFHYGLAESARKNPLADQGFKTCQRLNPRRGFEVPYVQGCASTPAGFARVDAIEAADGGGTVTLWSGRRKVRVDLDVDFVW